MKSFEPKTQDISRPTGIQQRSVNPQLLHLRQLTAKLRGNLEHCAHPQHHEPSADAVHDVRTGTRRIEAILDALQSATERNPARAAATAGSPEALLSHAIEPWRKQLRKIRRSAGAVRDLDVHRDLLADLLRHMPESAATAGSPEDLSSLESEANRGTPSLPEPPPGSALRRQAEELDAWLKHTRYEHSRPLVAGAKKWADKSDAHLTALAEALDAQPVRRSRAASAAATALEAFARLSSEMEQLYAENLHDFRKGAKKARYMAETAGEDEYAGAIGKALKKLQDEIGDWHDWLVLAEEAHRALGDQGEELIARIEQEREQHYQSAMKIAERMRGRLMGEWRASASKPRRAASPQRL